MGDAGEDPRRQQQHSRLATSEESAGKTEGDEGSSSADDFGLRRRFVGPLISGKVTDVSHDTVSKRRREPAIREDVEKGEVSSNEERRIQRGAESRRILDPEDPDRDQPLMMKKKKKKKGLAIRQAQGKANQGDLEKHTKKTHGPNLTKENLRNFLFGHINPDTQHDSYVIYVMRDFVIYLIFMIVTSIAIFGADGHADNYFANVLADLVVKSKFLSSFNVKMTFYDITHRREMWIFVNDILMELLYESSNLPDQELRLVKGGFKVNLENVLFGAPQIRQVRVKGGTCESAPLFKGVFADCADHYSEEIEDKTMFGMNKTAWIYKPPTQDHAPVSGVFATYGGGGFSLDMSRAKDLTQTWIRELQEGRWVRFGTRAVFIDFNLLNPNTQLFCAVKLVFEMPPVGGTVPNAYFTSVRLIWYSGPWGFFMMSCHIIFIVFIIVFTYEEILRMYRLKAAYFSWWNALEVTILLCSYVTIAFAILSIISNYDFLNRNYKVMHTYEHASFDRVVSVQNRYRIMAVVLAFFVWIKILKFSMLNKTVFWVLTAFAKVRSELFAATILMAMLIFGFALLGMSIAGHLFEQLSAIGPSFFALFGLIGGGLHFYFDHKINEVAFRAWLLMYIITCIVVFINIYVALIVHGFVLAQNDIDDLASRARFGDVLREIFCNFLLCIRKKRLVEDIHLKQIEKLNIKIYLHLADIFSHHGFDNREISLLFAKHNVLYGKPITMEAMSTIYEEINIRNQLFMEAGAHDQIREQLEKISRNVEQIDQTVMSVMTKVDTLTNKYLTDNVKK